MATSPYVIDEYVRWSDIDFAGIICYGAYLRFFELAETEIFREAGAPFGELYDRFEIWLPRRQMHCDFLHPARLDDRLRVGTYFSRIGTTSLTINFDVLHLEHGVLTAAGYQVLVCTSRRAFESQPLPVDLKALLAPFEFSPADARAALGVTAS